jgi:hydrogenase maturation protease
MVEPGPESVDLDGTTIRRGSRVRLRPKPGGDIMDIALAGRIAIVEGIDQDEEGMFHVAVTLEDDPGRDLGEMRMPGHRFYFKTDEVEPLPRVLVAGIGHMFLGDDGFGVEVVRRMLADGAPPGIDVVDYGIRGMDLAYAMKDYDVAIFVDAVPRGREPGTLYVIEHEPSRDGPVGIETHGMDPARVLAFARALGPLPRSVYVVGCEPDIVPDPDADEIIGELSDRVRAAVERAVEQVELLLSEIDGATNHSDEPAASAPRTEPEALP